MNAAPGRAKGFFCQAGFAGHTAHHPSGAFLPFSITNVRIAALSVSAVLAGGLARAQQLGTCAVPAKPHRIRA